MSKKKLTSRCFIVSHLMFVMGLSVDRARQIVEELEASKLVSYDQAGNLKFRLLEEHHEANHG